MTRIKIVQPRHKPKAKPIDKPKAKPKAKRKAKRKVKTVTTVKTVTKVKRRRRAPSRTPDTSHGTAAEDQVRDEEFALIVNPKLVDSAEYLRSYAELLRGLTGDKTVAASAFTIFFRLSIKGPVAASPLIRDLINEIMNTEYVQRFDGSMVLLYHYKNAGHEKGEWATTMPKGKAWLEFGYPVRLDYHPKGTET